MPGRFEDRVAVVTGGTSGIGRACATAFAQEGADVVIGDLDAHRVDETIALVEAAGRRAIFRQVDTRRQEDCEALVYAAVEEFGHVDVGVAAAGISNANYVSGERPQANPNARADAGHVLNLPLEAWQRVLDVNLTGVMLTDQALARQMLAQGTGGSIVNIASTAAKIPLAGASPYCVSKAGVWMLTKVMALELATRGIRVNAVGPGYTATPMTIGIQESELAMQRAMSITPMNRLGTPEEIAAAVLFLAGDEASYFTGQILHPAGGQFTD